MQSNRLHSLILVQAGIETGHDTFDPYSVYVEFTGENNHINFNAMRYFADWLDQSGITYLTVRFQCNEMVIKVLSDEDKAQIKLAFDKTDNAPQYQSYNPRGVGGITMC